MNPEEKEPEEKQDPDPSYSLNMDWTCPNCEKLAVDNDCSILSTVNVYQGTMFRVGMVIMGMCHNCGEVFRHPIELEPDEILR